MSLPTPAAFTESALKAFAESPLKQRKAPYLSGKELVLEVRVFNIGYRPENRGPSLPNPPLNGVTGWPGDMPSDATSHGYKWRYRNWEIYETTTDYLNNFYEWTRTREVNEWGIETTDSTVTDYPVGYPTHSFSRSEVEIVTLTEDEILLEGTFTDDFGSTIYARERMWNGYTEAQRYQHGLDCLTGKALGLSPEDYYANPATGLIYPDKFYAQFPGATHGFDGNQAATVLLKRPGYLVDTWVDSVDVFENASSSHWYGDPTYWRCISGVKYIDINTLGSPYPPEESYWIMNFFLQNIPITSNTWAPLYNTTGDTSRAYMTWDFATQSSARCDGWLTKPTLAHKPITRIGSSWLVSPYQIASPCS